MEYDIALHDPSCEVFVIDPGVTTPLTAGQPVRLSIDPARIGLLPPG